MTELMVKMCNTVMREHDPIISNRWAYDSGFTLRGFEKVWEHTGDDKYFDYIKRYIDNFVNDDGTIDDCKIEDYNLDNISNGKNLIFLYKVTKQERYLNAIDYLIKQINTQPKTKSGVYWHKKIYPNQIWLDGLFMAEPFCVEYAKMFGKDIMYENIVYQFVAAEKAVYNKDKKLYVHACDESKSIFWADKNTGQSPNVWGRAVGWYVMALVDVLDYLPQIYHNKLIVLLDKALSSLLPYQTEKGVWKQLIDSSDERNYNEASCSAMFAYALLKGIRKGYISKEKFSDSATKAKEGFFSEFVREEKDFVYVDNICQVAGLGGGDCRDGSVDYYMSEPIVTNDFKGIGAFFALCSES